jgi:N-methylhydantoinase B/oxoprolinase/acetone carboxylase alpha subunit
MPGRPMGTREVKKLIEKYGVAQLESCIRQQLERGENVCEIVDEDDEVIATLSKAGVVRELMDQGMTFADALRELGRRIRAVYGKE